MSKCALSNISLIAVSFVWLAYALLSILCCVIDIVIVIDNATAARRAELQKIQF